MCVCVCVCVCVCACVRVCEALCHLSPPQFLIKTASKRLGSNPETGPDQIKSQPFFKNIDWDKLARRDVKPPYRPKSVSTHTHTHTHTHTSHHITSISVSAEGL